MVGAVDGSGGTARVVIAVTGASERSDQRVLTGPLKCTLHEYRPSDGRK